MKNASYRDWADSFLLMMQKSVPTELAQMANGIGKNRCKKIRKRSDLNAHDLLRGLHNLSKIASYQLEYASKNGGVVIASNN